MCIGLYNNITIIIGADIMAKYEVTPQLAETLRSTRTQHRVTAKSVAEHIGKSQAYLCRLEKGDIKSIKEEELTEIFKFIFGNEEDYRTFLDTSFGKILDNLQLEYSDEEIQNQLWFVNYDTVARRIPIPPNLADDLLDRLTKLNISIPELCNMINSNIGITPEVENSDQYPFNVWQAYVENHKIKFQFIKLKVEVQNITDILYKNKTEENYVIVQAIAYYLLRYEKQLTDCELSTTEEQTLSDEVVRYLTSFKFYSLAAKRQLNSSAKDDAEREKLLTSFEQENLRVVNNILDQFKFLSEIDIVSANDAFEKFNKNLSWDCGFMMRIISLDFEKTNDISFSNKKQMLFEIREILKKYIDLPKEYKSIESYD